MPLGRPAGRLCTAERHNRVALQGVNYTTKLYATIQLYYMQGEVNYTSILYAGGVNYTTRLPGHGLATSHAEGGAIPGHRLWWEARARMRATIQVVGKGLSGRRLFCPQWNSPPPPPWAHGWNPVGGCKNCRQMGISLPGHQRRF